MRTQKQRDATWHNWQIYNLNSMQFKLEQMAKIHSVTDESKLIIKDVVDHIGILRTSMKQRRQ